MKHDDPYHKKLTVAVMTYNRVRYLDEALSALIRQKSETIDIIVYDNASQDGTPELISQKYATCVQYHRHPENIGAVGNGNYAINNCKSDYLMLLHDDDIIEDGYIQKAMTILDLDSSLSMVSNNPRLIDTFGTIIRPSLFTFSHDIVLSPRDYIRNFTLGTNLIVTPTVIFRAKQLRKHKLSLNDQVGPANDALLWSQLAMACGNIYVLSTPMFRYRLHPEQDSQTNSDILIDKLYPAYATFLRSNNLLFELGLFEGHRLLVVFEKIVQRTIISTGLKPFSQEKPDSFCTLNLYKKWQRLLIYIFFYTSTLSVPIYRGIRWIKRKIFK